MGRSSPNVYSPSTGDQLIPGAVAIDQFGALSSGGSLLSHGLDALCGWAAGEIMYAWAKGVAPTRDHIYQVFLDAFGKGLTVGPHAKEGVSTPQTVSKELSDEGIPNHVTHNWEQALTDFAGERPIEIMTQSPDHNLGRELPGDEYNVTGHFYIVEGFSPDHQAFIVSDPDNSAAKSGQLVYYTLDEMRAGGAEEAIVPDMSGGHIGSGGSASPSGPGTQGQTLADTGSIPVLSGLGNAAQNLLHLPQSAAQGTGTAIGTGIAIGVETLWTDVLAGFGAKSGGANFVERLAIGAAGVALVGFGAFVLIHEATGDVASDVETQVGKVGDRVLGDGGSSSSSGASSAPAKAAKLKKLKTAAEVAA